MQTSTALLNRKGSALKQRMQQDIAAAALAIAVISTIAGCGQTGALYLPQDDKADKTEANAAQPIPQ